MAFRVYPIVSVTSNLGEAQSILTRHETEALTKVGTYLRDEVRPKMREFTGASRRNVKFIVRGSKLNKLVEVFGDLVQTYVDEEGLPPGTFPPWGVGSLLYKWVERKGLSAKTQKRPTSAGKRKRPRKVLSHVNTRRPAAARANIRAGEGTKTPRTRTQQRRIHRKRVAAKQPGRSGRSLTRERAIRRVAFLVARTIFERGIRANHPFARTLEANRQRIVHDLQSAFMRAVKEINRGS